MSMTSNDLNQVSPCNLCPKSSVQNFLHGILMWTKNPKNTKMKKLTILFASVLIALTSNTFAQATASATATATIVAPIAISKSVDMNFGNVAVIAAGTVVLSPVTGT